jgi:hypothetical protein
MRIAREADCKSEILSTCPVESSLWLVRTAEFHWASTKQIRNTNSQMFKTGESQDQKWFWSFGFRYSHFEFAQVGKH